MADYGPERSFAGEGRSPSDAFNTALDQVGASAARVKDLLDQLRTTPAVNIKDSLERQELTYSSMQMGSYEGIVQTLAAKDAHIKLQRLTGRLRTLPEQQLTNRVYNEMAAILRSLDAGFCRMLAASDGQFERLYRFAKVWIERNPKKATAALPIGGAVAAAGTAAWHHSFGWCLLGMHAKCFCVAGGKAILASAASGFALGVVLAGIGLGVWWLMSKKDRSDPALRSFEDEQRQRHEAMVDQMKGMSEDETLQKFQELTSICRASFCQMDFQPGNEDEDGCPVCLETIDEREDALRAPNCQGRHFMHRACWNESVRNRGNQACLTCGI